MRCAGNYVQVINVERAGASSFQLDFRSLHAYLSRKKVVWSRGNAAFACLSNARSQSSRNRPGVWIETKGRNGDGFDGEN